MKGFNQRLDATIAPYTRGPKELGTAPSGVLIKGRIYSIRVGPDPIHTASSAAAGAERGTP